MQAEEQRQDHLGPNLPFKDNSTHFASNRFFYLRLRLRRFFFLIITIAYLKRYRTEWQVAGLDQGDVMLEPVRDGNGSDC